MLLARNINLGAFGPRKVGGYEYMWCKRIELRVFWYDVDLIHCMLLQTYSESDCNIIHMVSFHRPTITSTELLIVTLSCNSFPN